MKLYLGIDIGTSGVRTAVLDEEGVLISDARAEHLDQDPNNIDAEKWWLAVRNCLTRQVSALSEIGKTGENIVGISVDGTSGSMVLVDEDLRPVSRALMYNSIGFEAEAAKIAQHAPDTHITQGSNSALGRAMRLVSEAQAKPAALLHQADFIAARLLGSAPISDHNNTLKTGYDPVRDCWPEWIGKVIDFNILPKVQSVGSPIDQISTKISNELSISKNAVIYSGTTDSTAAFLAASPLKAGNAVTSLGSTLAVKMLSEVPINDPSIGLYSHRIGNVWLVGGASNTGGAVLLKYFTPEQIAELTMRMTIEKPTGLDYYPLVTKGERFPINNPELEPRLVPRPKDDMVFLQAMFEAMARIEADCYRAIENRGNVFPVQIFTAGGGAKNKKWTLLRAKELGLIPAEPKHSEASVGMAYIAGAKRGY